MKKHRRVLVVVWLLMAVPLCYALVSFAARPSTPAWLEAPRPRTKCVFPTDARYEHMRHLKRLRDQVLRDGRRDEITGAAAQGLGGCRGCHAHREEFCDRCHARASVALDCFGCHVY